MNRDEPDHNFTWPELLVALPYILVFCSLILGMVNGQHRVNNIVSAIVADQ